MSSEQVWYRFEGKRKDGSMLKLRIQDLPPARLDDALDLVVNFFARDEAVHRAVGIANNPRAMERYRKRSKICMSDPSYRIVLCCSDDSPDVKNLMGLSMMSLNTDLTSWIEENVSQSSSASAGTEEVSQEAKKLDEIVYEYVMAYNPVTEFNLDVYYDDKGLVVDPDYRGLGIAEHLLKVRRLMCKAHGVPMTGAWMTAVGTQIAGSRDGWETVKEIEYDYLAKKYDVTFTGVPRTMKFMIARVGNTVC